MNTQLVLKVPVPSRFAVREAGTSVISTCFTVCSFVAVVPHITDAIQEWVMRQAKVPVDDDDVEPQVCVIEVRRRAVLRSSKAL